MQDVVYDWSRLPKARAALRLAKSEGRIKPGGEQSFINGFCKRSVEDAEKQAAALRAGKAKRRPRRPPPVPPNDREEESMATRKKAGSKATKKSAARTTPKSKAPVSKKSPARTAPKGKAPTAKKKVSKKTAARAAAPATGPGSRPRFPTEVNGVVYPNFTAAARSAGFETNYAIKWRRQFHSGENVVIDGVEFKHAA